MTDVMYSEKPTTYSNSWLSIWGRLIEPTVPAEGIELRQQRLVAGIMLGLGSLTALAMVLIFTIPGLLTDDARLSVQAFTPLAGYVVGYLLVKYGYYTPSVLLLLSAFVYGAYSFFLNDSSPERLYQNAIMLPAISILIANILLPRVYTTYMIVVVAILIALIPTLSDDFTSKHVFAIGLLSTVVIVVILFFSSHREALEQDRRAALVEANDALQKSEHIIQEANRTLEQKVTERTAELEVAKNEAERSNQVKSAFLASMSHELRTPLNAIINFTTFVAEGDMGGVNEEQKETLDQVIISSKHLLNLINDVLDMSKIEAGSLRLFVVDDVNLPAILQNVRKVGESLSKDKPLQIEMDIAEDVPHMRGDRQRIEQIFLNIMSNAVKFTDEGKVTLRAVLQGDEILVSIQDTGAGIAPEDQGMVFESFKQTNTGLRQGGGTGLGMPISKSLAEAHGGRMWLESQVGEGATFFVALPVLAAHLTPTLRTTKV